MPADETHREPFIHLVDLTHDRVLIGWGAFWFSRVGDGQRWEIVDDEELHRVSGRRTCIGSRAEPFGRSTVQVRGGDGRVVAEAATEDRAWVWIEGLAPDTEYRYEVLVDGEPWASGERRDWVASPRGGYDLALDGRAYDLRFRTSPAPDAPTPAVPFVALGDYGVGTRSDSESSRRQRRVAGVLDTLVRRDQARFVVSLGDNVYQGEQGQLDQESGAEDDDWYSSFYAPYRYAIARVPFFPAVGNHDEAESESGDDREQMEDNFHLDARFGATDDHASVGPGVFYRFRFGRDLELVCLDTSRDVEAEGSPRMFADPRHRRWLERTFGAPDIRWRIPFSHNPAYTAGPDHRNDEDMIRDLLPLFRTGGVRLTLAGHEHNFQLAEADGITHVVSGAAGKADEGLPEHFADAHTRAWAAQSHLLALELDGDRLTITPLSGLLPNGDPHPMTATSPTNEILFPPFEVRCEEDG